METSFSLLVIDDDEDVLTSARLLLKQRYEKVATSSHPRELNAQLAQLNPDLILLDMNFRKGTNDGREGLYWLKHIKQVSPDTEVLLMTAYGEVEIAVKAIKLGAFDFILKPWTNEKLLATVEGGLKYARERQKVSRLERTKVNLEESIGLHKDDFVTRSPNMKKLMSALKKVAATDANVLLLGENGTGKSVMAMALHRLSWRRKNSFITVDLGAVSQSLFESELFGHKKGAFTDAKEDKPGRFETAHEGSLFLDEIGNLAPALQAKLLHVLQNRSVTRLGENRERTIDVRLICATNMPIYSRVGSGAFRQDLLYRINTVELKLPPLRERLEDIPILAKRFLDQYKRKYQKNNLHLSSEALDQLCHYHWPGNIRELEHCLERAVILADGNEIDIPNLQLEADYQKPQGLNIDEMEKHLVTKALEQYQGNISRASRELGLTRAALYRRIEKYGL
ncbi:MAG: sigma-54 dependent transcriptional regulator [Owenweeksia sp.]|nr:sigma-54 dependent transcriptional regulator [Owenweeksia sp.]